MGFLDIIKGILGGDSGPVSFGNVDPDDIESYWLVDHELDQAERQGEEALSAALAKWGLKSMSHWEDVQGALYQKHGQNPDFTMAASRVQHRVQMASLSEHYEMPAEYKAPVHGVDLERYAVINARLGHGQDPAAVLGEYQLDQARWQEAQSTWAARMGPSADAFAANILRQSYHAMSLQAQAAYKPR